MATFLFFVALCVLEASAANPLSAYSNNKNNIEFGRRDSLPVTLKRREAVHIHVRRNGDRLSKADDFNIDEDMEFAEDLERGLLFFSMSMSMPSMPSSPSHPTPPSAPSMPSVHPTSPSAPSNSQNPAATPNPASQVPTVLPPSSSVTSSPSFPSTLSEEPLTTNPTETEPPTFTLTSSPSVTPAPVPSIAPTTVFDLSEDTNGVVIVEPPHGDTTVVRMEIVYLVEALTAGTRAFKADIDWLILKTAVVASLEGDNGGVLDQMSPPRRRLELPSSSKDDQHRQRHLLSSSSFLRSCNATIEDAYCYIMEADIVYILNGNRNNDMAAYRAYLALSNEMGSFDDGLQNVTRVEYLNPQPTLPSVALDGLDNTPNATLGSSGTEITLRGFVIGAAISGILIGAAAILSMWCRRNRNIRSGRHIQLLEDLSETRAGRPLRESAAPEIVTHHPV